MSGMKTTAGDGEDLTEETLLYTAPMEMLQDILQDAEDCDDSDVITISATPKDGGEKIRHAWTLGQIRAEFIRRRIGLHN